MTHSFQMGPFWIFNSKFYKITCITKITKLFSLLCLLFCWLLHSKFYICWWLITKWRLFVYFLAFNIHINIYTVTFTMNKILNNLSNTSFWVFSIKPLQDRCLRFNNVHILEKMTHSFQMRPFWIFYSKFYKITCIAKITKLFRLLCLLLCWLFHSNFYKGWWLITKWR